MKIGNNVTIGAGAVVTKDIPANMTAAGVPAKVISDKKLEDILVIDGNMIIKRNMTSARR